MIGYLKFEIVLGCFIVIGYLKFEKRWDALL